MPGDAPETRDGQPAAARERSDAFISYASQDAAVADAVVAALERHGVNCWIAPRDVTPGEFYAEAIVGAINATRIVVVVLTGNAVGSPHVIREIERASAKRHPVVSLRIDTAPLPAGLEYFLSASHWLDATVSGIDSALPKLVEAVQRLLAPATAVEPGHRADSAKPAAELFPQRLVGGQASQWLNRPIAVIVVVITVVVAYLVVDKLGFLKHAANERPVTAVTPAAAPAAPAISAKSVAVLPFVDMSEKKDQEYFSDGLSEELIDHLAQNADLKVIARTSSFAFKGKNEDVRSIATKLGVANLLEGSVRKAGSGLRITAQLIRASDGVHLWSAIYDRKLNDIFKIQDEISTTVAKALNAALNASPAMGVQPPSPGTTNLEAYNLLLKGNYYFWRGNKGDEAKAVGYIQKALNLEPKYALAWAKLARTYAWQGYTGELTAADAEVKVRDAVQRALAIDPNCAEAYYARGNMLRLIVGDWTAAKSDFESAAALDLHGELGGAAQGNIIYLRVQMSGQFDDRLDWARRELERNPLDTDIMVNQAFDQQLSGHLDDSAATFRKLLELQPAYVTAQAQYGLTLLLMGKNLEALAAAEKESDEASKLQALACVYWVMDRRAESDAALGALEQGFANRNEYLIAAAHACRGEADAAFAWLDRAYRQRKGTLELVKFDPQFHKLHGDPRFNALLRKANLLE